MELGDSRAQAVRRFLSFERMMHSKGLFEEVEKVVDEYFENKHAEPVAEADLMKPPNEVFYLPIHVVHKESSTILQRCMQFSMLRQKPQLVSLSMILYWLAPRYTPHWLMSLLSYHVVYTYS